MQIKSTNTKIILTLILSFFIPVFLIDKPYTDDYARTIKGYFNWSNDGRPLSDLTVYIVNMGGTLSDISPFSYLLTIAFCIASSFIICNYVVRNNNPATGIASTLIFLSPFYIQNLLYKYDCVTMSLSILMCCIPFLDVFKKRKMILACISLISIICSLSLYQASVPLFFFLSLLEITRAIKDREIDAGRVSVIRAASGIIAIGFYKFIVSRFFISGDYGSDRSQLLPLTTQGALDAAANIQVYFHYIEYSFGSTWVVITCAYFLFSIIAISRVIYGSGMANKFILPLIITLSCVIFSTLMFFLAKHPVYYPRIMIGYSSFVLTVLCICCICIDGKWRFISLLLTATTCFYYFSQHSKVVSFIKSSYNNEKQISLMMKIDMLNISPQSILHIHGYPPLTDDSTIIKKQAPYVSDIYHPDLGWNTTKQFIDIEAPFLKSQKASYYGDSSEVCGDVIKKWNGIYTITLNDNKYHAVFRNESCT